MAPYNYRSSNAGLNNILSKVQPNVAFIVIIFGALIAFEIFNYSTTEHALSDLLGGLTFAGIPWATVLAIAFCGIDFAGIARLFTPEQGGDEPKEVWYLFGAWVLGATMNAILTWWGVTMAVANHTVQSSSVIDPETINNIVPVFVAVMVWVIRILIIGTLSLAMDRLLHPGMEQRVPIQTAFSGANQSRQQPQQQYRPNVAQQPMSPMNVPSALNSNGIQSRQNMPRAAAGQQQRSGMRSMESTYEPDYDANPPMRSNNARPDPTYHSLSMSARPSVGRNQNNNNNGNNENSNNENTNGSNSNRFGRR